MADHHRGAIDVGQRTCSIEGCERQRTSRGYCERHYRSSLKYGDPLATSAPARCRICGTLVAQGRGRGNQGIRYCSDECRAERNRRHVRRQRIETPEKYALWQTRAQMKALYGLTPQEYEKLQRDHGDRCAVCSRVARLHVDHDHKSRAVRGLLCPTCNRGLGMFYDNPVWLRAAAEYLKRYSPIETEVA